MYGLFVSNTLEIDTRFFVLYVKMNHCVAHLMVTSRVDSKGLRVAPCCDLFSDTMTK